MRPKVEVVRFKREMPQAATHPLRILAANGVKQLIAGGMGLRPLMGLNQAGIQVYYGGSARTVGEVVQSMLAGRLPEFQQEHTCGGSH